MTSRVPVLAALVALALTAFPSAPRAQVAAPTSPAPAAAADPATAPLDAVLPVDPAVRTGRLPNGLRYFLRQNGRPAKRVSMRLAVDVGSIQEHDDQRGLAHFLEHMAFNGSAHFKPGELVTFLESIGARFGPHVNASTSFDETIYMLDVPTDRDGYVDKGLLALRDFAGGATLSSDEIEKERGVVIEEWRGRLGAGSRITDQQLPVIFAGSRYADRLPIGLPEVLRTFPQQRLRDFYTTWYRADRMAVVVSGDLPLDEAERLVKARFSDLPTPGPAPEAIDAAVPPHPEPLYKMVTDPEAQGWSVTAIFKHAPQPEDTVGAYRRSLVRSLGLQMLGARLAELARRPDAPFLSADAGASNIGRNLAMFELNAEVSEGGIAAGLEAVVREARRVQQFGFAAAELERAKRGLLAGYERAYNDRNTAESPSLANELVRHFLQDEPAPGIAYEFQLVQRFLPAITLEEVTALHEGADPRRQPRGPGHRPGQGGCAVADRRHVEDGHGRRLQRPADAVERRPGRTRARDHAAHARPGDATARRFPRSASPCSRSPTAWRCGSSRPTSRTIRSCSAPMRSGGGSLASPEDFTEAVALAGAGRHGRGGRHQSRGARQGAGRAASRRPRRDIDSYTHGICGSATPKDLETALQLTYLNFTAPDSPTKVSNCSSGASARCCRTSSRARATCSARRCARSRPRATTRPRA